MSGNSGGKNAKTKKEETPAKQQSHANTKLQESPIGDTNQENEVKMVGCLPQKPTEKVEYNKLGKTLLG